MSKPQNQHTKYTLITFAIMEKKMNVHCIYINSAEKIQHLNILYFQIDKNICQWYNFSRSRFFHSKLAIHNDKALFQPKKVRHCIASPFAIRTQHVCICSQHF